jgi:hypothetical protein
VLGALLVDGRRRALCRVVPAHAAVLVGLLDVLVLALTLGAGSCGLTTREPAPWQRCTGFMSTMAAVSLVRLIAVVVLAVSIAACVGVGSGSSVAGGTPASAPLGPAAPTPAVAGDPPASVAATPTPSPCPITRPAPVFMPPKPYLASPPAAYDSAWFGDAHLWTMLDIHGETWGPWLFAKPPGLPQKTFWWSADGHPQQTDEWEPAITVTGRRLDGPETFSFGPGTNASADFGTAMLVGIDIPTYGCWELMAHYRQAYLSYVVLVVNP